MRPRGEFRQALDMALGAGGGAWHPVGLTTRELAARANVAIDAARLTLDNMVRAEEAVKLDVVRVPGVKRPVPVYAKPEVKAEALANAVGVWWLDAAMEERP